MAKRESSKVEAMTFEQAMTQLETLVEQIESGEVGLEEALQQYECGIALIGRCKSVLGAAETRIAELTRNARGGLSVNGDAASDGEAVEAELDEQDDEG